ncbi:hypothetical protein ABT301_31140 [Streptomyces sp. NPDC000987]|uniref:hypothetical protein n=1 Tax=Streptomyces sp. NPDC000987 TaxID=3154374 RepID=UPI0033204623
MRKGNLLSAAGYARLLAPLTGELCVEIAGIGDPRASPADRDRHEALLQEISAFRGHTYYADGQRPNFRRTDGGYADLQPYDRAAYHVMLRERASGALTAVVRLIPRDWAPAGHSAVEQMFGPRVADLITRRGLCDAAVLEGGRLAVAVSRQNYSIGPLVSLVGLAFAESIGRRMLWGLSGTKGRQDLLFARLGAHIHDEFLEPDPKYHDTMTVYSFDLAAVPPVLRPVYDRIQEMLLAGPYPIPVGPSR